MLPNRIRHVYWGCSLCNIHTKLCTLYFYPIIYEVQTITGFFAVIGGRCHKYHFCRDFFFSQQTRVCCDRTRLLSRQSILVATKLCLSRQSYVCPKDGFCLDKHVFVATKVSLSRQNCCRDKTVVMTKLCLSRQKYVCHDKTFDAISMLLSLQKTCFVATKMILVAAHTNDTLLLIFLFRYLFEVTCQRCN